MNSNKIKRGIVGCMIIIMLQIFVTPMQIFATAKANASVPIVDDIIDALIGKGDPKVLAAQQWLNKTYTGRYTYEPVPEDGITGSTTTKALTQALQIELGLGASSDGVFGNATTSKYSSISKNKPGTNSNIVTILQHALFCKGYGTYDAYGTFGSQTDTAVKKVERDAGLDESGVVTALLFKAILNTDGLVLSRKGDARIREIQQALNRKYNAYFGIKPCDGIYGGSTNKALIYALQAEEGLSVSSANGNFGPTTIAKCPSLAVGDSRSNYVRLLQYALYCNGYDPGAFNGSYGSKVEQVVRSFQSFMCLSVTGNADKGTMMSLFTTCGDTDRSALACDTSTRLNKTTAATLANAGYKYVGRYLTNTEGGTLDKKMTDDEVKIILNAGLSIFPIYQTYGGAVTYYTVEQANKDALSAVKAAKSLGVPLGSTIYFAVDYDAYDFQVTEAILPYYEQIKRRVDALGIYYNVGIYAPRNVCNRVYEAGYVKYCFVSDASKGYSGNLGYRMPVQWSFDQFKTDISVGTGTGLIHIDKVGYSGRDKGFNHQDKSVVNMVINTPDAVTEGLDYWADPVNLSSGAHEIDYSAMSVYGAQNVGITLNYSSNGTKEGIFGVGWSHNYESFLVEKTDEIEIYQNPSNFIKYKLKEDSTNQYFSTIPGRQTDLLTKNTDGSFMLNCNGETKYYFNTKGKLVTEESKSGLKVNISYPSETQVSITDGSSGQSITLNKNESGLVTSITDEAGRSVKLNYDTNHLLTNITNVNGNTTTYTYDNEGRVLSGTDGNGVCYFTDSYDTLGRVIEQKDAEGHTTCFAYDDTAVDGTTEVTVTDRTGAVRKSTYNERKQLIKIVDQNGAVTVYEYDENGNLILTKDALGNSSTRSYDASNRPISEKSNTGAETKYEYDANGNLACIQYEGGDKVTFKYDSSNRKTEMIDLRGTKTTYVYNEDGYLKESITGDKKYTYNYEKGLLKSVTDPLGRVTTSKFDKAGNLVSSIDALENETKQVYNNEGKVTELTDPMGNTVYSTFDCRGALLTQSDAKGNIKSLTYDGNGNIIVKKDAKGNETKYEYDAEDRLIKTTDAAGNITSVTYDAVGRPVSNTDAEGNVTKYEYDAVGNIIKQTNASEGSTTFNYDSAGNVLTKTASDGNRTTYEYDKLSRRIVTTNALGGSTKYTYNAAGDVLSVTDPLGKQVFYTYDQYGNKISSKDANGNVTTYEYDLCDNLIKKTDALGGTIVYTYDKCDRLIAVTDALDNTSKIVYNKNSQVIGNIDALGNEKTKEYDENGNVKSITDEKGNVVSTKEYDELNRETESTDALGNTSYASYNEIGQLTKSKNALGQVTSYEYDANSRMTKSVNTMDGVSTASYNEVGSITALVGPLSGTVSYAYDKEGKCIEESTTTGGSITYTYNELDLLEELKNARDQKTDYKYDIAGRVTSYTDNEGTVSYTYDNNGNVLTITDGKGTIKREFDALGRVTKYTSAKGESICYQYDKAGNLVEMTYPDGSKVTYTYDADNQLIMVSDWKDRKTEYTYDNNGNLLETKRSDGSIVTRTYDEASNMISMTDTAADGTVINQYGYEYDKGSRLIKETSETEQAEYTMTYDNLNRVISRTKKNLQTDETEEEKFQYDDACNITSSSEAGKDTKMTYDKNNCLKSYNGAGTVFDADGNMEAVSIDSQELKLSYDSNNRLAKAGADAYAYDAENYRLRSQTESEKTEYLYDTLGNRLLMTTNSKGNVVKYIYGIGLIGKESEEGYSEYHYDLRGSTTAITDSTGNITDRYSYSTYGKVTQETGDSEEIFLYCGRDGVITEKNGLLYMRARYYSPDLKRFVNADVLKGSISSSNTLNRYAYVEGNPITLIDPFGLSAEPGSKSKDTGFWGMLSNGASSAYNAVGRAAIKAWNGTKKFVAETDWNAVGHTTLDAGGMFPAIGEACDAVNAVWYLSEGDNKNAALTAVSLIPFADIVTKGGKLVKGGKNIAKVATKSADMAADLGIKNSDYLMKMNLQFFAGKNADEAAEVLTKGVADASQLAKPGEDLYVGTYSKSRYANVKSGLNETHTPHHAVQDAISETSHGRGITINIRKDLHELTGTFKKTRDIDPTDLRKNLAADAFELKKILTDAGYDRNTINRQLKELIRQNEATGNFIKKCR